MTPTRHPLGKRRAAGLRTILGRRRGQAMAEYAIIIVFFVVLGVVILYVAKELVKYYNFYAVMIAIPFP